MSAHCTFCEKFNEDIYGLEYNKQKKIALKCYKEIYNSLFQNNTTYVLDYQVNTYDDLHSRIESLLLSFPEMPDIKGTAAKFDKLHFNRKNQHYKKTIEIAKVLLLQ